jgi:hypothetical protein
MFRALLAATSVALVAFSSSSPVFAQGGYTKEKYPQHGLRLELARDYDWLAIQPNEDWIVLQWVDTSHEDEKKPRGMAPAKLKVVRIDYVSDPGPSTPGSRGPKEEPPDDEEPTEGGEEPAEVDEKPAPPPPINSWNRYLERELGNWSAKEVGTGKSRDGFDSTEYELSIKKGNTRTRGWAYVWENPKQRSFVVLGWAAGKEFEEQRDIWRHTATKMRFSEPEADPEAVKWERFYARRPKFKQPEYRIKVRTGLDGGWKAEDTENYIVIYNTKDQPLVRRIVKDLESIRKEYVRLFPAVVDIDAVSTVRVCADRTEYMQYGGPPRSAGYWYYVTEELVLYDGTKREKGKKTDKLDTFIVLYHEAFHQYIYYSVGQLAPHSWFNEGYGDFFSGAQIKGGKVKRIGPNRWRLDRIQGAVSKHQHVPWDEIIRYERAQYYGARQSYYYAQGWSMVYFLNQSKVVQKHPRWSKILPTYFEELKASWVAKRAELESQDKLEDEKAVAEAQLAARNAALDVAFLEVDIQALEAEWMMFVMSLEL